jgi:Dimerisation domain
MRSFGARDAYHEMMEMILGFWVSQTIRTIADWSLADHLATGALTAGEIARREDAAVETTVGLLRAGVGLGLMTVSADGRFHGTERLATLRTDAPGSLRPIALSFIDPEYWQKSLRRRACRSTAGSPSVRPWPWYAVRCRSVHATRLKMWNHVRNYWLRTQVDAGDGCVPDVGGRVRFGDYLQSLADEQNLLRREY